MNQKPPALSRRSPRLNWGGGVRRGKMFWRALSEVLASSGRQRFHSNRARIYNFLRTYFIKNS